MIDYPLANGLVQAAAPVEVGHNAGHFWFSSLHRVGQDLLVCPVIRSADVAQGKWPAELFISLDGGLSWQLDQHIESYGHGSVALDQSTTLLMPYELWPLSPADRHNGVAPGTVLVRQGDGLQATTRQVRFCGFPKPLAPYHQDELLLHHNGRIQTLPSGQLFTLLYGRFVGDQYYSNFAVTSEDGGCNWLYRGTIADNGGIGAPEGPNEADAQVLDNGDLLCIYRVSGNWDYCKSYSRDEGRSWSAPVRLEGMASVQPRLARLGNGALVLSGGRPGLFLWICTDGRGEEWQPVNLAAHHNQAVPAAWRFSAAFCRAEKGEDPAQSTAYTGIMPWGEDQVIVSYDRLANGWSGAPGANGAVDRVFSLKVKVVV